MGNVDKPEKPILRPVKTANTNNWVHQSSLTAYNSKEFNYAYANRNCMYRSEPCELSEVELKAIEKLKATTLEPKKDAVNTEFDLRVQDIGKNGIFRFYNPCSDLLLGPVKLILDTDIGTDFDDVLALLMLLNMNPNEYELLGTISSL
jgi:hypothetical protein